MVDPTIRPPDPDLPRSPTSPLESGKGVTVGHFTLIREIGGGGMGVIYEARQREPNRVVAVKLMRSGFDNPAAVERFRREANLLGRLQHPNIAQVYEAGVTDWNGRSIPYYAMEYVAGAKTLVSYAQSGRHSIRERIALLIDLCSAVQHGHDRGVLHRDLKPANVLIDADGRLKLIDFGVARVLSDADGSLQTSGDAVLGTVPYMSPEQVGGDSHAINFRSDVYGIGVIAWQLLSGRLPYDIGKRGIFEAANVIATQDPPPLHTDAPELDAELEAVLRHALAKHREDRYASAKELADDLAAILRGDSTSVVRLSKTRRLSLKARRGLERHPYSALAACALLATLIGLLSAHPAFLSRGPGRVAQRWMNRFDLSPAHEGTLSNRLMVIGVEDEPSIAEVAKDLGIEGVVDSVQGKRTLRRMYGRLVAHLAEARPAVIALDIIFRGTSDFDGDLAKGIRSAGEQNVPVVAALAGWDMDSISPTVIDNVRQLGGVTASVNSNAGGWEQHIAVRQPARPMQPSLALLAAMARLEPRPHRVDVALRSTNKDIEVSLFTLDPVATGGIRWLDRSWSFPTRRIEVLEANILSTGLPAGTEVLTFPIDLPPLAQRERAFIGAAQALRMSSEQLAERVGGKVVLIADFRTIGEARHTGPDGTAVPDAYAQVMAIDALIGTASTQPAGWLAHLLGTSLAAVGGAAIAWVARRRQRLLAGCVPVAAMLCIAACVGYLVLGNVRLNPVPLVIALLCGSALGWPVVRLSRRARIVVSPAT